MAKKSGMAGGLEYLERTSARAMVIAGCSFWIIACVVLYASGKQSLSDAISTSLWPFLGTLVTLVIGWTHERFASLLLFIAAVATIAWGAIYGWEPGVWAVMGYAVVGPTALSAVLFMLAARASDRREDDETG